MPELPEVEVTRRRIAPLLVGRRLQRVKTTAASYFFLTPPATLKRRLVGRQVMSLDRHGKYLVAQLDDRARLVLHLGMTGQLFADGVASVRLLSASLRAALTPDAQLGSFLPDVHTHLQLGFHDTGPGVYFRDVRKFGKVQWLAPDSSCPRLERLGIDALAATGEALYEAARSRRVAIKTLLLDQAVIAGVGNIYADEALFYAAVHPTTPAHQLDRAACECIVRAVQQVMQRAIETGGSSISDYVAPDGSDGGYQDERRVYARAGEPCYVCNHPVERIVLGQRSTHFCRTCQRAPRRGRAKRD